MHIDKDREGEGKNLILPSKKGTRYIGPEWSSYSEYYRQRGFSMLDFEIKNRSGGFSTNKKSFAM